MAAPRKPLDITAERLTALLELDPSTEHGWRWRTRSPSEFAEERMCAVWNAKYAGKEAGGRQSGDGRPVIGIDGKTYDPRRLLDELGEAVAAIASSSSWFASRWDIERRRRDRFWRLGERHP